MTNDNYAKTQQINAKMTACVEKLKSITDLQEFKAESKNFYAILEAAKSIHQPKFYESWSQTHIKAVKAYQNRTFKKPEKTDQQPQKTAWKKWGSRQYNNSNNTYNNGLQEIATAINRLADAIEKITIPSNNK